MPLLVVAIALLGLAVGSFLNVVIYRVPRGESIVHPGSHCPNCSIAIRNRHNIPVLSWLLLRGKCNDCRASISARYPLVELITALLFVGVTLQVNKLDQLSALPAYLLFAAAGIALTAIDLDVRRLPNAIIYPTYAVLAVLFALAATLDGSYQPLFRAVIGGAALYSFYLALAVIHPGGMGFGDVKLAGLIGAVLGFLSYPALLIGAFAAFIVGGVIGAGLLVLRNATRKTMIPFGPSMVVGALIAIFAAGPLASAYSNLALHA